jgi:hypothetical protein
MGERFLGRASLDSIPLGGSRTLRVVAVRDGQRQTTTPCS